MLQTRNDTALLEKDDSIAALHEAQARLEASYETKLVASRAHFEEATGELYEEIDSLRSQVHALTEQVSELHTKLGQVIALTFLTFYIELQKFQSFEAPIVLCNKAEYSHL